MKRIIALTLSISSLIFSAAAIASEPARSLVAQSATNSATQVQPVQVDKRELIAVAASATQNNDYQLALRVANNVIGLFPDYANAHLYRAMAAPAVPGIALYRLGELEAAKVAFTTARTLYLKTTNTTAQEQKDSRLGLNAIDLHLKLINQQIGSQSDETL